MDRGSPGAFHVEPTQWFYGLNRAMCDVGVEGYLAARIPTGSFWPDPYFISPIANPWRLKIDRGLIAKLSRAGRKFRDEIVAGKGGRAYRKRSRYARPGLFTRQRESRTKIWPATTDFRVRHYIICRERLLVDAGALCLGIQISLALSRFGDKSTLPLTFWMYTSTVSYFIPGFGENGEISTCYANRSMGILFYYSFLL